MGMESCTGHSNTLMLQDRSELHLSSSHRGEVKEPQRDERDEAKRWGVPLSEHVYPSQNITQVGRLPPLTHPC